MIRIRTLDLSANIEHKLKPTIFPDGTSQVWHLPEEILRSTMLNIVWNFEAEREVIDLLSLRRILNRKCVIHLHIPFLPYARQDKDVSNEHSFNLEVLADIVNSLGCHLVTAVDVHNPKHTASLIKNFKNIEVDNFHDEVTGKLKPDFIVFPDKGAYTRYYGSSIPETTKTIVLAKTRDGATGAITGHEIVLSNPNEMIRHDATFLIVDDLCDGGATFISVAKELRKLAAHANINLYVTHGIFSKGRAVLHDAGIHGIFTTDSLKQVFDMQNVFEV